VGVSVYDIIIGRSEKDRLKLGTRGSILLGKHFVKMGRITSLSNPIYMDMARSHVVFVCGKRGGGKSYTMGVMAEGMADLPPDIKQNIAIIMLDTMGVYWTMRYPNRKEKDLLQEWALTPKGMDAVIYTPIGHYKEYREKGIPTDKPFAIRPSELSAQDWLLSLDIAENDPVGVLLEHVIHTLTEEKGNGYSMTDIIEAVKRADADPAAKLAAANRLDNAKDWGIFDEQGTPLSELAKGGQITILDVSCYATMPGSWNIKNLVIGLVAQKLFIQRMLARKDEEYHDVHKSINPFSDTSGEKQDFPLVWLVVDEAHEFLPAAGKTMATDPLVTILREGRQPGISLLLATQQPGKIHTDVMTQADIVISHRITAKLDTDALGMLMQSYMRKGMVEELDQLPRVNGAALVFDDTNERLYPMRVRPRFTWHGGESPTALKSAKNDIKL
jgi:DNA helicase HerA-like ATPase